MVSCYVGTLVMLPSYCGSASADAQPDVDGAKAATWIHTLADDLIDNEVDQEGDEL
jgi:hypothetical protein